MRKWSLLLVVLGVVFAVAACGGGATAGTTDDEGPSSTSGKKTTTTKAAKADGTREDPVPLGTAAKVGDWEITVTACELDATETVMDANEFNDAPADGHQYALVTVKATYTGDESGTFWVDMSGKFLGSGGNTFDSGMAVAGDDIIDSSEAFPGASVSGDLVFDVETTQATGGLLMLEPSFSFDDPVFFALD